MSVIPAMDQRCCSSLPYWLDLERGINDRPRQLMLPRSLPFLNSNTLMGINVVNLYLSTILDIVLPLMLALVIEEGHEEAFPCDGTGTLRFTP